MPTILTTTYTISTTLLGVDTRKLLTTSLSVQPVIVGLSLLPNVVVNSDWENHKESLALDTTERVKDGSMESTSEWLLSVTRNRVTRNSLLSRRTL